DQWDWEKIISKQERNLDTLKNCVRNIMQALFESEKDLCQKFKTIKPFIKEEVFFITSQELFDMFKDLTPKQREDEICKLHKTVFIMQIGGNLKNGEKHDGRAPDYDDWSLNGDLLLWYEPLNRAIEISSMGIRVDEETLANQLSASGCNDRRELPFHKKLLNGELPLTMGGGIGQSRICMMLLQKAHIGEVQSSTWTDEMIDECKKFGINLL
ncbi:MAG: aspartate--ammonia ligase, partial [Oscillospiraceae bacterium]